MADKGGKGKSPVKGGKSSLKPNAGNGDSSTRSKKGRKVQFESEDSIEPGTPISNGTPAMKGGKGDNVANGSKKSTGKAPKPVEQRLEQEIPPNSVCLMDCEAAEILQGIHDQMVMLSQDPDIKLPVSFDMGLKYAKRGGTFAKPKTVKNLFEPLKKYGVSDCEICLIANICPESVDEVAALIPALKPKMNRLGDPLGIALKELAFLKEALANLN